MDTAKLLAEVFASGRLDILKALRQRPLRYTDLTRELDLSDGEVSRHLHRLHQAGLVEKLATGTFQPTPLALVALGFERGARAPRHARGLLPHARRARPRPEVPPPHRGARACGILDGPH